MSARYFRLLLAALIACLAGGVAAPAEGATQAAPSNDDCMACHADASTTRSDGRPVTVDADKFAGSVHAVVSCVDCHADLAAVTDYPHAEKLEKVNCASCHDEPVTKYEQGIHAQARRADGSSLAATCVDCHGMHDIKPSSDAESRTNHLKLPATCGRCHGDPRTIRAGHIEIGNVLEQFQDSIHGRALSRSGLVVAPNCSDCHRAHDILRRTVAESPVHKANVPATCGKCHEGISRQFHTSVHGGALAKGNTGAPACHDCHSAHGIQRGETEAWRLEVVKECGTCHAEKMKTYRDTFHGQVTALGFVRVATCASCHGSHQVLSKDNAASTIAPANLVATCRTCHENANENFVKYDPHADKDDRQRNPMLYYASRFMSGLLVAVFAFFGMHTALWFSKTARVKRLRPVGPAGTPPGAPGAVQKQPKGDREEGSA